MKKHSFIMRVVRETGRCRVNKKVKYKSNASACGAIARMRERGEVDRPGFSFRAYPCKHCGSWHVGHKRIEVA